MTITVVDFINFAAIFPMIVLKEIFIDFINDVPPIDSLRNAPKNDPTNNPTNAPIKNRIPPPITAPITPPSIPNTAVRLLPPEYFAVRPANINSKISRKVEIKNKVTITPIEMISNPVIQPQIKAPMLMRNVPGIPNQVAHTRIRRIKIPAITAMVDVIITSCSIFLPLVPIP